MDKKGTLLSEISQIEKKPDSICYPCFTWNLKDETETNSQNIENKWVHYGDQGR